MVQKALETLRRNLDTLLVGVNLLPDRFTIKELQLVHEAILGEPLNRSAFQRRMLNEGILQHHEKRFTGGRIRHLMFIVLLGEVAGSGAAPGIDCQNHPVSGGGGGVRQEVIR